MGNEPVPREFQVYQADYRMAVWDGDMATLAERVVFIDQASGYFATGTWPVQPLGTYYLESAGTGVTNSATNTAATNTAATNTAATTSGTIFVAANFFLLLLSAFFFF